MSDAVVFHFLPGSQWRAVRLSQRLVPMLEAPTHENEPPVVWATEYGDAPDGVARGDRIASGRAAELDLVRAATEGGGIYRITFPASLFPIGWAEWRKVARIPPSAATRLARQSAARGSSVARFVATFLAVPLSSALAVDRWRHEGVASGGPAAGPGAFERVYGPGAFGDDPLTP